MQPARGIRGWLSPTLVILDDRGQRTTIVGLDDLRTTLYEAGRHELFIPIRRRSGLRLSRWLHIAGGVCVVWTILAWALNSATLPVALVWLLVVAAVWVVYDWPSRMARRVRRALLEHARCPACGFELDLAAREPDHRVVCRECGSAWVPVG